MHNGFRAYSVAQFRIGIWLDEQGIGQEDIFSMETMGLNSVRVTNNIGQVMDLTWNEETGVEITG